MEFASPADEFPLGTVFGNLPEVTVELERIIPHDHLVIPYFRVRGAAAADIEASFETHAALTGADSSTASRRSASCEPGGNGSTSVS